METVFVDILNIETRDELVGKINEEENRINSDTDLFHSSLTL